MNINEGARIVVEDWLHLTKDNLVYFVTDETKLKEADAFSKACDHIGARCKVVQLKSHEIQNGKSIDALKWEMAKADAIVGATNYSFITTDAVNFHVVHSFYPCPCLQIMVNHYLNRNS